MSSPVLSLSGVGKGYRSGESLAMRVGRWIGLEDSATGDATHKWVLRGIDFEVLPGQAVAVIGQNGAGKSTLLKIVTGTVAPTEGRVSVSVHGKVRSILELGLGFNPEFTGRQNALSTFAMLGVSKEYAEGKMQWVETFAEIGEYFDQPVRTYSSGMMARLAFSVVTCDVPDLLIIDEVLSVGDSYFQHKSFARIRALKEQGAAILLVTHGLADVKSLCDRAILLECGRLIKAGAPEEVIDFYNAIIAEKENATVEVMRLPDGRAQTRSGTGEAVVSKIAILDQNDRPIEFIDVGQIITLSVEVEIKKIIPRLIFGYGLKDRMGQIMYGTNTHLTGQPISNALMGTRLQFAITFPMNLGPGSYSVQTALCSSDTHLEDNFEWCDLALVFTVVNMSKANFEGCAWINPEIRIETL